MAGEAAIRSKNAVTGFEAGDGHGLRSGLVQSLPQTRDSAGSRRGSPSPQELVLPAGEGEAACAASPFRESPYRNRRPSVGGAIATVMSLA